MNPRVFAVIFGLTIAVFFLIQSQTAIAQVTGTPSKFCHTTDGAFTVCPGGGQEWSDVPFLAFPETQSFLYADQANLNPTLASPNNTLTLMYDECGRAKALGSDEYVLVTFKTVEVENAEEKLKHYVLHLFTDGTIIFIEDGILQPPGRSKVVEGMRGAVGFGRSPRCAFNHVIAEFQIELSAAGGHSYSSEPLFWSSTVPLPQPPPPPPSGPQIIGPRVIRSSSPIEMGDLYSLNVGIIEANSGAGPVTVNVSERPVPLDCSLGCPPGIFSTVDLPPLPGQPQDSVRGTLTNSLPDQFGNLLTPGLQFPFPFPPIPSPLPPNLADLSYHHFWNWTALLGSNSCVSTFTQLVGQTAVGAIFSDVLDLLSHHTLGTLADAALEFYTRLRRQNLLIPQAFYQYDISAADPFGTASRTVALEIKVPEIKQRALERFFSSAIQMAQFTVNGLTVPPFSGPSLTGFALEAALLGVTCRNLRHRRRGAFSDSAWTSVWMIVRNWRQECEHDCGIARLQ